MSPVWHDGPLSTLMADGRRPVAWSVTGATDPGVRPTPADLADAALVRDGATRLARRLLARALVARLASCPAETVVIARDARSAPVVVTPHGWHVSLSRRDDRVLVGAARWPIGVDRECIGEDSIPWDMLSPDEAIATRQTPPADQAATWLRRWTIKEAHAKLVGEPRRIRPEAVETHLDDAVRGGATFEGRRSTAFTRIAHGAIETILWWHEDRPAAIAKA